MFHIFGIEQLIEDTVFSYFSTCDFGWFRCMEPYVCGVRQCEDGRPQKVAGLHDENYETTVVRTDGSPLTDDISDLYTTGSFSNVFGSKHRSLFQEDQRVTHSRGSWFR